MDASGNAVQPPVLLAMKAIWRRIGSRYLANDGDASLPLALGLFEYIVIAIKAKMLLVWVRIFLARVHSIQYFRIQL